MATFNFLCISKDRYDGCIDTNSYTEEGESWQEALGKHLKHISDNSLYEIHDIFRFENGEFESCESEISAEEMRRAEKEQIEAEAKAAALAKQKEDEEKTLYLSLKKKYG